MPADAPRASPVDPWSACPSRWRDEKGDHGCSWTAGTCDANGANHTCLCGAYRGPHTLRSALKRGAEVLAHA